VIPWVNVLAKISLLDQNAINASLDILDFQTVKLANVIKRDLTVKLATINQESVIAKLTLLEISVINLLKISTSFQKFKLAHVMKKAARERIVEKTVENVIAITTLTEINAIDAKLNIINSPNVTLVLAIVRVQ